MRVLKVYTRGMALGKNPEDCWIFVMKKSCVWQTQGFIRQTKRKSLIVLVDVKQNLYDGAKTRVRVGSAYSEEFKEKVGVHQGSVLSPLLLAIVVDVITENARRGVVNELLYADDLVLMSKTMQDFGIERMHWKVKVKRSTSENQN